MQPTPLGEALREHRRRVGLTQHDLALRAGLSVRALRDLEQGNVRHPHQRSLQRLLAVLGVPEIEQRRLSSWAPVDNAHGAWIGVLGPLRLRRGEVDLDPGPPKVRSLLGLLAVQPGQLLTRDEIVDALWGERPPSTCLDLVHTYVARLRRQLDGGQLQQRTPHVVVLARGGYRLEAQADELDLLRFIRLAGRAHDARAAGDMSAACDLFARALAEWRGSVLADLGPRLRSHPAAIAVSQRRVVTALTWADLAIDSGRADEVIGLLQALVGDEPLHEGLHARLMLALASCGQQATALRLFADLRARLVGELGVEPDAALREVHLRILRQQVPTAATAADRSTATTSRLSRPPDPSGSQRPVSDIDAAPAVLPLPPPSQLPCTPSDFTGREDAVAKICRYLTASARPAVPIVVIAGRAGVGKTALAVHAGHLLLPRFPDGQLYSSLRGTEEVPSDPAEVLAGFLQALGVTGAAVPAGLDERATLYRSVLAGRRVLVVLDDAASEAQVRPLLPGRPPAAVIVTGRRRLVGVEGARMIDLDLLPAEAALRLLGYVAGPERVAAEPAAARAVISECGRLPLAVRIAGARLAAMPQARVGELASRLADERRCLAELSVGDLDVRSSFALSYRALARSAQRAFRLVALLDIPDVAAWLLAALRGSDLAAADETLRCLADAQLLDPVGHDSAGQLRYRLHDLLRLYARERLAEESPAASAAAFRRAAGVAVTLAERATARLQTDRRARAWLTTERVTLLATVERAFTQGEARLGWRLVNALEPFFEMGSHFTDWQHTQRLALEAARAAGDRRQQARAAGHLAGALWLADRWSDALDQVRRCLPVLTELGERREQARALRILGRIHHDQGRWDEALACLAESRKILEQLADPRELATTLRDIGIRHRFRNEAAVAVDHLARSIVLYDSVGDHYDAAHARLHLACAHRDQGELARAADMLRQTFDELAAFGDPCGQAQALFQLAVTYRQLGSHHPALGCFTASLRLARRLGQRLGEGMILLNLAQLHTDRAKLVEADRCLRSCIGIFRELDSAYWQGRAHAALGDLHIKAGRQDEAVASWKYAMHLLAPLDAPEAADVAAQLRQADRPGFEPPLRIDRS